MNSLPAPTVSLHQLSLYNTGRMSPEQIIGAFAARGAVLDRIIADLIAEKKQSRAQHHLIVGQRGMGKTMLLARIAAELQTNPELVTMFIPLTFAEEQYAVDRLSKFWLNCLDSLADAREVAKESHSVAEIDATVGRLTTEGVRPIREDQPFADEVYAAFAKAAQSTGQRPVLLVDNLQLVFERLASQQQHSLRELLMRPGAPILVGASPSPPPQSQDYGAAFYDHFKVHYLRPLEESEMRDLLVHLADATKRDDVRQRVLQHPTRLKVLRQLTGGNPRTTLTLFFLYAEDFAPSVFGVLEGLLDHVTPLYKARFEELTPQQQVITSAIANHWDPIMASRLSSMAVPELSHALRTHSRDKTSANLPASTISAQVDRLEKTGTIERVELFDESGPRIGYQIAERFFNIWFLMRSASRRQRREVEFLTRFLEVFYEPSDRARLASHLQSEKDFSPAYHYWIRALAHTLTPTDAHDLQRHADLDALRQKETEARRKLDEVVDFQSLRPHVLAFADLRNKLVLLVPEDAGTEPQEFAEKILGDRKLFVSADRDRLAASERLSAEEIRKALDSVEASSQADGLQYGTEAVDWLSRRLATGQLAALDEVEDWEAAFQQAPETSVVRLLFESMPEAVGCKLAAEVISDLCVKLKPGDDASARQWDRWGYDLVYKLGNVEKGREALCRSLGLDDARPDTWVGLGICLKKLGRFEEAVTAYQKAVSLDEKPAAVLAEIGDVFCDHLSRYGDAENAYRNAIASDGKNPTTWRDLGLLLSNHTNRHDEAEAAFRKAIALDEKNAWYWSDLGMLLRDYSSRFAEAEAAFKQAILLDGKEAYHWIRLGNLYCDFLNRLPDAVAAFTKVLELDPSKNWAADALLFLHRDFLGEGMEAEPWLEKLLAYSKTETPDVLNLHRALFAAYAKNWGLACISLESALAGAGSGIPSVSEMGWLRASAVLLHLNYGAELLTFLDQRGDTARLRPWVEALRALQIGDRRALQNIAPEIRTTAEVFYDGIECRLLQLPEKTRRRPIPKPKRPRRRR